MPQEHTEFGAEEGLLKLTLLHTLLFRPSTSHLNIHPYFFNHSTSHAPSLSPISYPHIFSSIHPFSFIYSFSSTHPLPSIHLPLFIHSLPSIHLPPFIHLSPSIHLPSSIHPPSPIHLPPILQGDFRIEHTADLTQLAASSVSRMASIS